MAWLAWSLWLALLGVIAAALLTWIRRTSELVSPLGLCLATIGVFVLPRAGYLLWFHRAPLTSGGLPLDDQTDLITATIGLALVGTIALLLGHRAPSAARAGGTIRFSVPDPDPQRAIWFSALYAIIGVAAVMLLYRALGSVGYALSHQYAVASQLDGKAIPLQLTRMLLVPTGLLLIDWRRQRIRWMVWLFAAATAIAVFPFGHRSLIVGAAVYPILLYHLAHRRIAVRYMVAGTLVASATLFSFSFIRLLGIRRIEQAASKFASKPSSAVHFVFNAAGELKILDATTIVVRDVPSFMPLNYGTTFWRAPWMVIPRGLWGDRKPVTLGEVITQRYLPQIGAGYPPMAIGEFYAAGGPFAVVLGFFVLGWLGRLVWEWRLKHTGVGNASIYIAACYFFVDFTRVGDPSRTIWFFLLGFGFFTIAFSLAAAPPPKLEAPRSALA